jgi:multidrug efflux pump subunit AcrA (membrane-fusion protein)
MASQQSGKIWGIDRRFVVIALIFVVLIVPVFPRDKIIYVDGQTTTTQTFQSTSYMTSLQSYMTTTQNTVQVYVGNLQMVSDTYYQYYQNYYQYCYYDPYGNIYCDYNYWPYGYNQYTTTVQIDPSDRYVKRAITQESGGLYTVTLTSDDGQTQVFRHVSSMDLTLTGTANVVVTVTQTNTITSSVVNPQTTVSTVSCQKCMPEHITEHVSILQLLLGF